MEMAIDDRIGKWETFKLIVGQRHCQGVFPGDIPKFEISPEKVDEVYLTIKKMQRCYYDTPDYPVSKYFAKAFESIERAYLLRDMSTFHTSVTDLMELIDAE